MGQPTEPTSTNLPCGLTIFSPTLAEGERGAGEAPRAAAGSEGDSESPTAGPSAPNGAGRREGIAADAPLLLLFLPSRACEDCLVTIAQGNHPFPSRTRKLSPAAPMVLPLDGGRVGRCQAFLFPGPQFFKLRPPGISWKVVMEALRHPWPACRRFRPSARGRGTGRVQPLCNRPAPHGMEWALVLPKRAWGQEDNYEEARDSAGAGR